MIHIICSVLDAKAQYYARPFTARTDGEAIRIFSDAVNDNQTAFFHHPEDYQLYRVGTFDDDTGIVVGLPPHLLIAGHAVERKDR